jgi:hypothetical protein
MNQNGIPMLILVYGFGLWWVLAPESVIRFYCRFYQSQKNSFTRTTPRRIRLAGLLWLILITAALTWTAFHPRISN